MGHKKVVLLLTVLWVLIPGFTQAEKIDIEDCYETTIISPYPFMGNDGEVFKLADGTIWRVSQERTNFFMYEYYPKVLVCPSSGQLMVGGKTLFVEKKEFKKSMIEDNESLPDRVHP